MCSCRYSILDQNNVRIQLYIFRNDKSLHFFRGNDSKSFKGGVIAKTLYNQKPVKVKCETPSKTLKQFYFTYIFFKYILLLLLVVEVCEKGRSLQSTIYKAQDNPSNPSNFPNGTFILLDIDIDSRSWLSHASPNTNNEFAAGRNTVVGKQPIHQAKKREIMICNFFIGSFFDSLFISYFKNFLRAI